LAFDGSGEVKRNQKNASLCVFKTGKHYNCDLNASYNIGARYFIKEYAKSMSAKTWSQAVAKVPLLERRTQCTLSTYKALYEVAMA
ncbi:MAG: transposase, partial [Culicoidibacterales bacterium]